MKQWWQKGILVGFFFALIISLITSSFLVPLYQPRGDAVFAIIPGYIFFILNLPVFPIIYILYEFFEPTSSHFGDTFNYISIFISWIIGGIFYAFIFKLIAKKFRGKEERKETKLKKPFTWEELSKK